jgi:hypothetical protein
MCGDTAPTLQCLESVVPNDVLLGADVDAAQVALVVTSIVDEEELRVLRGLQHGSHRDRC